MGELDTLVSLCFFQAEDGIRDYKVTGVQTCALPIWDGAAAAACQKPVRGHEGEAVCNERRAEQREYQWPWRPEAGGREDVAHAGEHQAAEPDACWQKPADDKKQHAAETSGDRPGEHHVQRPA